MQLVCFVKQDQYTIKYDNIMNHSCLSQGDLGQVALDDPPIVHYFYILHLSVLVMFIVFGVQ